MKSENGNRKKAGPALGISAAALVCAVLSATSCRREKAPPYEKSGENSLRVASFNIAAHKRPNMEKINMQLRRYAADVAGIQEVDVNNGRNSYDMLGRLAGCGDYPYTDFQKCIDFEGGDYGIGIVSGFEITGRGGGIFRKNKVEDMGWHYIEIEKGGKKLHVYNTHLNWLDRDIRQDELHEALAIMDADPCPYKLMTGDFNTEGAPEEIYPMMKSYNAVNGWDGVWLHTFNRGLPGKKTALDNIISTRNMRIVSSGMARSRRLSDHNMIFAEFELLDEEVPSRQLLDFLLKDAKETKKPSETLRKAAAEAEKLSAAASQTQIDEQAEALELALKG